MDRVVELAVVGARREAVAHQQEVARGRELRRGDEQARLAADPRPQPPHQRRRVPPLRQPDLPALIEIRLRPEPPHRVRDSSGQVPFVADLKVLDLTHHTLPSAVLECNDYCMKRRAIEYYRKAARWMLPHLKDVPVSFKRYPGPIHGEAFWEKDAPSFTPPWVRTVSVPRRSDAFEIHYIVVDDAKTLTWIAGVGGIEI